VVGPVCESADVFEREAMLPAARARRSGGAARCGAYGAVMSSNYNGRGRLAELTVSGGRLARARAGEYADALEARTTDDPLES
jgi:diaminopimelate decarboxylase